MSTRRDSLTTVKISELLDIAGLRTQGPGPMSTARATFVRLYNEHFDEVHAFCARRVGRSDADDVAAEVFAVAWRRIDDVTPGAQRAWIFGVARRVVLNQWRSKSRRARLVERTRATGSGRAPEQPETVVVRRAEDDEVLTALRDLRDADQEILRLSAWEELSGPEIAVVLGISTAAVQQRLHRAKKRLARRLAPEPDAGARGQEAPA